MGKRPPVDAADVIKVLLRLGFTRKKSKRGHQTYRKLGHPGHVAVPVHGARELPEGTFRSILRQAQLSVDEFFDILESR